jgi:hypothetical protein
MGNLFLRQYLILRIQQLSVVLSTYDSTKRDHFHSLRNAPPLAAPSSIRRLHLSIRTQHKSFPSI